MLGRGRDKAYISLLRATPAMRQRDRWGRHEIAISRPFPLSLLKALSLRLRCQSDLLEDCGKFTVDCKITVALHPSSQKDRTILDRAFVEAKAAESLPHRVSQ